MGHYMKRTIILGILAVMLLAGCESAGNAFNPIVGRWESSLLGTERVVEFERSGEYRTEDSILGVGASSSGIWTSTRSTLTMTDNEDESSQVYNYDFNSDKTTMTLTSNGVSRIYDRQ